MRLCSWSLALPSSIPVLGLERVVSSEGLSLASDFFCVLGLEPCVFDSTSANKISIFYLSTTNKKLQKIKKSISLDNTLFRTKKNRVFGDFRKNVGLLINSAVGQLENLAYRIFKTASFVAVTRSIPAHTVADPENFGGGGFKAKTSKIRMSSPKLRLIFRPKSEIQTFFSPKIR